MFALGPGCGVAHDFLNIDPDDVQLAGTLAPAMLAALNRGIERSVRAHVLYAALAQKDRRGVRKRTLPLPSRHAT